MAQGFRTTTFFFGMFALVGMLMVGGGVFTTYAGFNPPLGSGEKVRGFALQTVTTGQNAMVEDDFGNMVLGSRWLTVGSCKGVAFAVSAKFPNVVFDATVTADDFMFVKLSGAGPAGCYSVGGGEKLIFTNIQKFNNTGNEIGYEGHLQVVE